VTSAPIFIVDAFVDGPFSGNPAAVALFKREPSPTLMARIAAEMNLSETAFVWPAGGSFGLRWFTPTVEVPLCGHATLAASRILIGERGVRGPLSFETKSGVLRCAEEGEWLTLDFPELPCVPWPVAEGLTAALGLDEGVEGYRAAGAGNALLRLPDGFGIETVRPDFSRLGALRIEGVSGVIVTVRGDGNPYDFHSRYFTPWDGILEDPATGSAHCTLAPFWAERMGKEAFTARQASARGGLLRARRANGRVFVSGRTAVVLRGSISL